MIETGIPETGANPTLCGASTPREKPVAPRRFIFGIPPIAARSTCGSPGTARGFTSGTPIGRPALVQLFSTSCARTPSDLLVTPVERVGIVVEDAPFLGVELLAKAMAQPGPEAAHQCRGPGRDFPEHPLKFLPGDSGGLKPYALVRGDLWALVKRALFYDLVAWAKAAPSTARISSACVRAALFPDGAHARPGQPDMSQRRPIN